MDKTLRKGLRLLELLSESDVPRGAADLSRDLDLTRSNVFRLLTTLAELGYVRNADGSGRYVATLRAWEVGMRIMAGHPVRRLAQPALRALHAETGENVYLAMLDAPDILYLDKVEMETSTHVSAQPGMRLPAFLVASGRALLAFEDEGSVLTMLAGHPRAKGIDPAVFAGELRRVRQENFAQTNDGSRPGVVSLAAPIFGHGPVPLAAIALSLPSRRAEVAPREALRDALLHAAADLSQTLGHRSVPGEQSRLDSSASRSI